MKKATLHGIRICKVCRGICHEDAYRTRYGKHSVYFCCEEHARAYYATRWYKQLDKLGIFAPWNSPKAVYSDERWAEDKRFYLEPVDITTPKERGQ